MTDGRRVWRVLGGALLVLLASAVCVGLGLWQLDRHHTRAEQVNLIVSNLEQDPVPLADLLPGDDLDPDDVWRPVTLTGSWVPDSGVQLRNRPVEGANASHALALFETQDGRVLLVDRGWWRQDGSVPEGALAVPDGEQSIVVRLRAREEQDERTNPAGEVFRVTPEAAAAQSTGGGAVDPDALITSAYGMAEDVPASAPLGTLPDPGTSLRSHLSYAFQWWFFAAAIPVAAVIIVRRGREEAAEHAAEQEGPSRAQESTPTPRRRRASSLEEEEDALLDAREHAAGLREPARRQASDTSSA
ncbi:SURF1 family protein [Serinibacter salmoneus]|uniref:SURF1-like protein n=1 Tax=Serinibacter salmoneus TaxID=556530 RepID=A0A2A9CZF0_9MICO|nr:SURF1 family protein [Serinibacter salmoneus]PFG19817.1 cytochrome oxidase assembly protein ShyY1 [Serinibacter salmoneus]